VKLDKIARQIRRDIAASPKKAAVLGLMVLVALYFWAPMIWGWIKPGDTGSSAVVAASDVILEDEPVDPAKAAKKEGRTFSWEKVRRKVAADPRMTPAIYDASWSDPFRQPEAAIAAGVAATKTGPQTAAAKPIDPAALGLTLNSVAISAKRRAAVISGQKYREGELVPLGGKDGASATGIEFRLTKVGFHEVQLEYQGHTYTLELSRPRLAPGDTWDRSR
jgi:hypothetical protein